ncbi:protein of unknown function [Taphrina deformans PYCC 5710]|uniref:Uncharacterized protein n=1 Tax=Taphrina deformans (strain PYCC 5710 / ATCC 11124 / CBS 356.35 / IMI 108563 / JCM 9778 / NBRC 8474) TaxID=1097556 RepID=R4XLV4_TAPDE|nr:protein of unknown function [Taphrina deformans PYCC 5710]|eukprot:CCG84275.1 protein of unknown function [Taphrina deformans PYCC 5710]
MVDTSIYIVIILAGTVFFFITKLRMTQEAVHKELERQNGVPVTNHAFPSGNMGSDTISKEIKQVGESVKVATGLTEQPGRPLTPRTRSRKAD